VGATSGQAGTLTVMAPIRSDQEQRLLAVLDVLNSNDSALGARRVPSEEGSDRTHFARFAVLSALTAQPPTFVPGILGASRLIFTASFDGPLESYVDDLLRSMSASGPSSDGTWVEQIWGCCEGFPAAGNDPRAPADYLLRRRVPTTEFIASYGDSTVREVRTALCLQERIRGFAQLVQGWSDAALRSAFMEEFPA
jgi:hypothetical protein